MELTEATFLYSIPPKPKTKMFVINVSFTISAQKKQRCPINATSARYTIQIYTNKLRSSEQKKEKRDYAGDVSTASGVTTNTPAHVLNRQLLLPVDLQTFSFDYIFEANFDRFLFRSLLIIKLQTHVSCFLVR
jgi:hypothetical protein